MVFLLADLTPLSKSVPATAPTIVEDVDTVIPRLQKRWIPLPFGKCLSSLKSQNNRKSMSRKDLI